MAMNRNERVVLGMMALRLLPLLVVLAAAEVSSHVSPAVPSLTCTNDYINNISCEWRSSEAYSNTSCRVHLVRRRKQFQCDLIASDEPTVCSCSIQVTKNANTQSFTSVDECDIEVRCGDSKEPAAKIKDFKPSENVRMRPPDAPIIVNSTVSWGAGERVSRLIYEYEFQIKYKRADQTWEEAESRVVVNKENSTQLNENMLEKGALYQVKVRVRPAAKGPLKGVWSHWSPVSEWTSTVGIVKPVKRAYNPGSNDKEIMDITLAVAIPAVIAVFLTICICGIWSPKWSYKCLHVPDPSKYFDPLNSVHGGNFQKWLSPTFSPESFDTLNSEPVSPVEVFEAKDTTSLFKKAYPSLQEHWDSSGQSSCFSNMGYFYSKHPSSYEIESCSVYFSYQPAEFDSEEGGSGDGGDTPIQTSSSYERLDPSSREQSDPEHPDSGCGMERGEEGDQETEDGREGGEEANPSLLGPGCPPPPFNPAFLPAFPPPFRLPGSHPQLLAHPPFPFPLPGFDFRAFGSGQALDSALSKASSALIQPSGGGYLSVKDVQNRYCNKSI
nr:PREDICTED: interleukin-2 receptor subunit beta isoform X3 [Lepisosteus oculatus]